MYDAKVKNLSLRYAPEGKVEIWSPGGKTVLTPEDQRDLVEWLTTEPPLEPGDRVFLSTVATPGGAYGAVVAIQDDRAWVDIPTAPSAMSSVQSVVVDVKYLKRVES
jgi:hypothetical protein